MGAGPFMNGVWQSCCGPARSLEGRAGRGLRSRQRVRSGRTGRGPRPRSPDPARPCARAAQGLVCKASYAGSNPATVSTALTRQNEGAAPSRGCRPFARSSRLPSHLRLLVPTDTTDESIGADSSMMGGHNLRHRSARRSPQYVPRGKVGRGTRVALSVASGGSIVRGNT